MAALVCIAPGGKLTRKIAAEIGAGLPGVDLTVRSISGYLASPGSGRRVLLCPAGRSLSRDLGFLRRAARKLLWSAPTADFRDAIGGLRTRDVVPRAAPAPQSGGSARGLAAALLLEGHVDAARARAALESAAPRDWIVESPRHVHLPERLRHALERAGVRWSALEPVELVAVYAAPALARARAQWKRVLPAGTRVWVRGSDFRTAGLR
ncbi:MAG: hypothetical protein ABI968_13965 [Acidobacteriota bacterium]